MSPIRIHLGPMPEMLRAIITDLLRSEADIEIVGRSNDGRGALGEARDDRADVLITEDKAQSPPNCLDAILSPPPLAVLAVSADGRNAAAVSLVRQSIPLESGPGPALAAAVRELAGRLGAATPP